jgi:hypothetical protein
MRVKDKGQGTKDEGRRTKDEGRRTKDEEAESSQITQNLNKSSNAFRASVGAVDPVSRSTRTVG